LKSADLQRSHHYIIVSSVLLFAAFCALYFALGLVLVNTHPRFDFFGADMQKWFGLNMAASAKGSHPLLPLFIEPFAQLVRRLFADPHRQAVALNASFGASAVVLAYQVFLRLVRGRVESGLLALLYGLSMSQLVFGSLPESYSLAACSIIATNLLCLICLEHERLYAPAWIVVGLFSFGVTITNVAATAIAFLAACRVAKVERKAVTAFAYVCSTLAIAIALAGVQTRWLGVRNPFSPGSLEGELEDVDASLLREPMRYSMELGRNLYLLNIVGGYPGATPVQPTRSFPDKGRSKIEYFGYPLRFGIFGLGAAAFWLAFWGAGVAANARAFLRRVSATRTVFLATLSIVVAGNMVLHASFNVTEMYLHTLFTSFPILLLAVNPELLGQRRWKAALATLTVLMGVNNITVTLQMIR
jgi:hypothetical protein